MKLVERTYRIDAPDVNDLNINVSVSIDGQAHVTTFSSAFLFVQWAFGFSDTRSYYEFLIHEDIRCPKPYAKVTCEIRWVYNDSPQGSSLMLGATTIVNADCREPQSPSSPYFKEHWEKAWHSAVASAKARIQLGYLKGVKLVEDASDNA